ncbi:MAG: outer membrane lipoprotein-sorting protein [Akkermansiaceae bacterium]|nr:outer membrane lipoprotein-sorting protein [Akkermansiaceae bacterium]
MKKFLSTLFIGIAAMASAVVSARAEQDFNADDILYVMRQMTVSQQNTDVMGAIRKGAVKVPFSLSSRGDTIVFQYKQNNAWHRFDVRIKEKNVDIMRVVKGKAQVISAKGYSTPIAGTDVCYEDLSLRFLYWTGAKLIDDPDNSRVKGRDCHIVEVANPKPSVGQFAWVRMWVDKENGTAWQIDGYGKDGKLRKRFTITSVQRLDDGRWFFKQMKLEVRDPKDPNRNISINYLDMEDLKK